MVETQQLVWNRSLNRWEPQLISTLNTSPILNQTIYVSKTGSDDTGSGSYEDPFLTIAYALSVISGANINMRYAIHVSPGEYIESFNIKPWVSIIGLENGNGVVPDGAMMVEITAPTDTLGFDASWNNSGYSVAWMTGLGFTNHQTWQEDGYMVPQLNFQGCSFNSGASFIGPGTAGVDNVMLNNCLSNGGLSARGWQFLWTRNCTFLGGEIHINGSPAGANENTAWLSQGDSVGATLSPTTVVLFQDGYGSHFAEADLSNTAVVGNLILNGAQTLYSSTIEGVPCSITLLNGANPPVLISCASSLGYNPAVDGYWLDGYAPYSVSAALDQLAAKTGGGGSKDYALFYALMPGDNSATVAPNTAIEFPQDGPFNGSIVRSGASTFNLPTVGDYEVSWQVSVDEAGQLQLALNGVGIANTVVGRATGTNQLCGNTIIRTTLSNSILSVINPVGNSTALTITPIAGGTHSVSATLVIKAL